MPLFCHDWCWQTSESKLSCTTTSNFPTCWLRVPHKEFQIRHWVIFIRQQKSLFDNLLHAEKFWGQAGRWPHFYYPAQDLHGSTICSYLFPAGWFPRRLWGNCQRLSPPSHLWKSLEKILNEAWFSKTKCAVKAKIEERKQGKTKTKMSQFPAKNWWQSPKIRNNAHRKPKLIHKSNVQIVCHPKSVATFLAVSRFLKHYKKHTAVRSETRISEATCVCNELVNYVWRKMSFQVSTWKWALWNTGVPFRSDSSVNAKKAENIKLRLRSLIGRNLAKTSINHKFENLHRYN